MATCGVGCCCHLWWDGSSIFPHNLLVRPTSVVVCVEVKGFIDVLILTLGFPVRGAVVTRVVQCSDISIFPLVYKRILLDGTKMDCRHKIKLKQNDKRFISFNNILKKT